MEVGERRVSEIMRTHVVSLAQDEHLDLADDIMRLGRIRHMPVLEDGRLVGMVSARDLLAASLAKTLEFDAQERRTHLRSVKVAEAMTSDVASIAPDATLREAAQRMLERRVGALPVVGPDRHLVGLVSETDLVRIAYLGEAAAGAAIDPAEESGDHAASRLEREVEELQRMRDELRVRIHLGRAEAKDLWEDLEHKLRKASREVRRVARLAREPARDVAEAARALLREVREGYHHLRGSL